MTCIDPYCAAHYHDLDYVEMLNCAQQGRPGINAKNKTLIYMHPQTWAVEPYSVHYVTLSQPPPDLAV